MDCCLPFLLTQDLLFHILDQLPDDADRKSFRAVCKPFHQVESIHRTSLTVLRTEFIPALLRNYKRLNALDLSVCPRIDDGTMALLSGSTALSWIQTLKKLVVSRSVGLTWVGLEMLVQSCKRLKSLDVSSCTGFGDREAEAVSRAVGLEELKMDRCWGVSDVGLAKIVIGCEKLERLSMKWCGEISDIGINLLSKKCVYLKELDISYMKVTNKSIESISSIQSLKALAIVGCGLVDDVGLHYLQNSCSSLQVIDVSRCNRVSPLGLISVICGRNGLLQLNAGYHYFDFSAEVLNYFKDLSNLKRIRIDGAQVSDYALQIIGISCRSLVDVGFSKCKGVTDSGISRLVSSCPNLKKLDLTCCHALTDRAIVAIAESCKNLVCLKLESCNLLTEKSFDSIGTCCFLLEELDLTDCSGVTDEGLEHISKCSELICFKLGHCTNISDKGLSSIALKCSKLLELDLYRCEGIRDDGLAALGSGCKKLKKLNLSYCNQITDKGMMCVGYLKELYELDMRSLPNVSGAGLTAVASGCLKLAELDMKNCGNVMDSGFLALSYYSRNLLQINISYSRISDAGLWMLMSNLTRLQYVKLINLSNVSLNGFELALRASCFRLKKLKMLASVSSHLSPGILNNLQARGCKIKKD